MDFHGADAPVQLAEGAAGQKVAVKMVKVSKAQQDAAQAAAGAKLPSMNGQPAFIEGLSIKQRVSDDSAKGSGEDKPSRGMCFQVAAFGILSSLFAVTLRLLFIDSYGNNLTPRPSAQNMQSAHNNPYVSTSQCCFVVQN